MKRYSVSLLLMVLITISVFSQQSSEPVLLKINGKGITRSEFLNKYSKEGNGISVDNYLNIFINNKLKVAEAQSLGLDTTAAFNNMLNAQQRNITKSYFRNAVQSYKTGNHDKTLVEGLHIYRYLPQNTPSREANKVEQQMDSLYKIIRNNPSVNFNNFVKQYSDDKDTFRILLLHMPEEFEKVAFNLNKGEISKPFFTPQGIHIIKVLDKRIQSGYNTSGYIKNSDESFLNKLKEESGYTPNQEAFSELQSKGSTTKVLFTLGNKSYTGHHFDYFSQDNTKSLQVRINDFVRKSLYDYENNRLASGRTGFGMAIQDYKENILVAYIDKIIYNTVIDDKELEEYFNDHKKEYRWELPRFKGIVVHTKDKKTGKKIKKKIRKIPENQQIDYLQRTYNNPLPETVIAQQGTFAVAQNPFVDKMIFKVGNYTPLKSHPFTIVVGKKVKGPESFNEVRNAVVIDYRNHLEERWLSYLHKKSKVEINEEVLKTVNNH